MKHAPTHRNVPQSGTLARFEGLESRRLMAADLTISNIAIAPVIQETNVFTQADFTISNRGNTASPARVGLRLAFSVDDKLGNADDWDMGTVYLKDPIPAGGSVVYHMNRRASGQGGGFFRLIGQIDPRDRVAEKREYNNVAMTAADSVIYANKPAQRNFLGSVRDDVISIRHVRDTAFVTIGDEVWQAPLNDMAGRIIDAGSGNDVVVAAADFPVTLGITGSGGDDVIIGGAGNDEISGANGRDRIFGGKGNDTLFGGGSNDRVFGEDGDDIVAGNRGQDMLYGNAGRNTLYGGDHNDRLYTVGNAIKDILYGGTGTDTASADLDDERFEMEG